MSAAHGENDMRAFFRAFRKSMVKGCAFIACWFVIAIMSVGAILSFMAFFRPEG